MINVLIFHNVEPCPDEKTKSLTDTCTPITQHQTANKPQNITSHDINCVNNLELFQDLIHCQKLDTFFGTNPGHFNNILWSLHPWLLSCLSCVSIDFYVRYAAHLSERIHEEFHQLLNIFGIHSPLDSPGKHNSLGYKTNDSLESNWSQIVSVSNEDSLRDIANRFRMLLMINNEQVRETTYIMLREEKSWIDSQFGVLNNEGLGFEAKVTIRRTFRCFFSRLNIIA